MDFPKGLLATKVDKDWWKTYLYHDIKSLNKDENDVLLVVGDATGVVDDLENFIKNCPLPFDTMAINYSYKLIPWQIQHFVAGDSHMEDMQKCAAELPDTCTKHCWNPNSKGFDIRWIRTIREGWSGTTANLCVKIGVALGYTRIVLAGVPMDNTGNWYQPLIPEDDVKQGKDHRLHLAKWQQIASRPVGRLVRSMSGNTKMLLGEPDEDWYAEAVYINRKIEDEEQRKLIFN